MLSKSKEKLLLKILSFSSPSSFEHELRDFFIDYFEGRATVGKDVLGNAAAVVRGRVSGSKVLLTAHSDEIGFIITGVDTNGFLLLRTIGGIEPQEISSSPIVVLAEGGPVRGVICRPEAFEEEDLTGSIYADIGAKSRKVALSLVSVGDGVVWDTHPARLIGDTFFSRGVDDKIGVYVVTRVLDELIRKYKSKEAPSSVFGILSPMEEIGDFNSIREAANKIGPGAGIVLDVEESTDYPGAPNYRCDGCGESIINVGAGPVIDVGVTSNKKLSNFILKVAAELNISVQKVVSAEETSTTMDRLRFGASGVPCVGVYIPIRYMHTPLSIFSADDVEKTVKLLVNVCEEIDSVESFIP